MEWLKKKFNKERKIFYNEIRDPLKRKNQVFRVNKLFSSKYMITFVCIVMNVILFFLGNYCIHLIAQMPNVIQSIRSNEIESNFGIHKAFEFQGEYWIWYIILLLFLAAITIKLVYQMRVSYKPLNVGQKGTSRWTTRQEIREQYKAIPEKATTSETFTEKDRFEGGGGFPVAVEDHKIFIDDSPVNNLILGITRSGKGEMFVFSLIDIYSRAEKQASMVVTDPKLELASSSYKTLTQRGYEVHILNLIDMIHSMGYNPLQLIIEAYEKGVYEEAELLCKTLAYSIYNPGASEGGNDKFFTANAAAALSASILAHVDDCLTLDKEANKEAKRKYDEGRKRFDCQPLEKQNIIRNLFYIKDYYHTDITVQEIIDIFAKKELQISKITATKYLNVLQTNALKDSLTTEEIALKLSLDVEIVENIINARHFDYVLPEVEFIQTDENRKNTMYSIINTFMTLASTWIDDKTTALDLYFQERPGTDRAKMKYASINVAGDKTKSSIFSSMLTDLEVFTYTNVAKLTAESTFDMQSVGFGEKPIAIFLGIPDYDSSVHFLASLFIRQMYFVLAKKCAFSRGGKCLREVIFILDEFGNLPVIEGMDNILTVCLGRNIRFNLIIQAFSQIKNKYGDAAETIIGNCGNQVFIQSNDKESAKDFSELIGNETITTINRSGKKLSLDKSQTELLEERPLIYPQELRQFMPGECAIVRAMKREDTDRGKVKPTPILNVGKYAFKYRYQYLSEFYPSNVLLTDLPVESREHINPEERVFDVHKYLANRKTERMLNLKLGDTQYINIYFKNLKESLSSLGINRLKELNDLTIREYVDLLNRRYEEGILDSDLYDLLKGGLQLKEKT